MSFLFGGRPQLSSEQKIAAAEAEIDMVSDMYSRYVIAQFPHHSARPSYTSAVQLPRLHLQCAAPPQTSHRPTASKRRANSPCCSLLKSCSAKCIDTSYREADLNKGESVCLDRCVSKFFEVNVKVSEKMQGEAQAGQGFRAGM
jgi:import inner membrane translocase subunit TIM10